ncbi:hypothetical protein SNOG_09979 [Parastagonospora nodorum SN15]|uniref:Uncharacterized protein n=1 Tax=Phaeosphaeria nodorum (strain SN15 / ATCC MYA-4574 / FGSC 10173) TaxID=321614 RepID=Q0UE35_PHANO|nr:hypothetical protein SNOG_09979 [Parastagonospora nodorum SN15]EAT82314.1 hypothetical protein SNOG_09979 [Parastagonospora nodorum SN15]
MRELQRQPSDQESCTSASQSSIMPPRQMRSAADLIGDIYSVPSQSFNSDMRAQPLTFRSQAPELPLRKVSPGTVTPQLQGTLAGSEL